MCIPGPLEYEYILKDHLGSIRVVFDDKNEIIQESHIYAFGMEMTGDWMNSEKHDYNYLYTGDRIDHTIARLLLPINIDEAIYFYSIDQNPSFEKEFIILNKNIIDYCKKGSFSILDVFLDQSLFVDGYHAESYFDWLVYMIKAHPNYFKAKYEELDEIKYTRFCTTYENSTKGKLN